MRFSGPACPLRPVPRIIAEVGRPVSAIEANSFDGIIKSPFPMLARNDEKQRQMEAVAVTKPQ